MIKELQNRQWQKNGVLWALVLSAIIVIFTGVLARITLNIDASVINNPDLAVVILLKEDAVTNSILLRQEEGKRHYLVETNHGKKLVILAKKENKWSIESEENLHE